MCQRASRDDELLDEEQAEESGVDPRCFQSVESYDDDAVVVIEFLVDPSADFRLYAFLYELEDRHYAQVLVEPTFPRYPDIASPSPGTRDGLTSLELHHETEVSADPGDPLGAALTVVESMAADLDEVQPTPTAVFISHSEYEPIARWVAGRGRNCIIKGPGVGQSDDIEFTSYRELGTF